MTTPLPTNVNATDWTLDPDKGAVEHRQWHDVLHGAHRSEAPGVAAGGGVTFYGMPGVSPLTANGNEVVAGGRIYYEPLIAESPITVTDLAIHVKVAAIAGGVGRLAVYSANTAWQPVALMGQSSELAVDTTGIKTTTGLSILLPVGRYLAAFRFSANTGPAWVAGNTGSPIVSNTDFQASISRLRLDSAYGAWAASSPPLWVTADAAGGEAIRHCIMLRWTTP